MAIGNQARKYYLLWVTRYLHGTTNGLVYAGDTERSCGANEKNSRPHGDYKGGSGARCYERKPGTIAVHNSSKPDQVCSPLRRQLALQHNKANGRYLVAQIDCHVAICALSRKFVSALR
jgi:hypothetical protein